MDFIFPLKAFDHPLWNVTKAIDSARNHPRNGTSCVTVMPPVNCFDYAIFKIAVGLKSPPSRLIGLLYITARHHVFAVYRNVVTIGVILR